MINLQVINTSVTKVMTDAIDGYDNASDCDDDDMMMMMIKIIIIMMMMMMIVTMMVIYIFLS
jgi:hypothetical protein